MAEEHSASNIQAEICFVGALLKDPDSFVNYGNFMRSKYDFSDPAVKFFYDCFETYYLTFSQTVDETKMNVFMSQNPERLSTYKQYKGWKTIQQYMNLADENDCKNYFDTVKKYSLVREYGRNGFPVEKILAHKNFDKMSPNDIYRIIRTKADKIHTVINAGEEAVELTAERHKQDNDFFAVIVDWQMPNMDGIATAKEIRRRVGDKVPVIILSAYDWSDIEIEARTIGVNAFISKPLFKSRMMHLFHTLLGHEPDTIETSAFDEFARRAFEGKKALLVEDNELNAEIAGEILGMAGIAVEYANDGKEAVDIMEKADDNYYDVIFMDIQMPVMNGYEATRAIRSLPGDYAKCVPILAMTANAFAEDVTMAKNSGMNGYIAKPLDFDQLLNELKRWL